MYKFNFTTITPLHISNGEVLDQNFHYNAFRGDFYKIDHLKFAKLIAKKEKLDFSKEITTSIIESWIKKHQLTIIDDASSYSVKIHDSFRAHLENTRAVGRRQVIEFINSNGKVTNRDLQGIFKISAQAVHKELVKLVELKVIKPVGEGRALHYILV